MSNLILDQYGRPIHPTENDDGDKTPPEGFTTIKGAGEAEGYTFHVISHPMFNITEEQDKQTKETMRASAKWLVPIALGVHREIPLSEDEKDWLLP